jgi:hypothetical protein
MKVNRFEERGENPVSNDKDVPQVVWNEVGSREHFCQFYEDDGVLIDTVDGFVGPGLIVGDSAVIIATAQHIRKLNERLIARGIDVDQAIAREQYFPLDAAETLAKFMNQGWPDQARFLEVIRDIIARASAGNRRVRAFGEMVALLWADGNRSATIRLEKLWNDVGKTDKFSLFCAYPKNAFNAGGCHGSLIDICAAHSRIISASGEFKQIGLELDPARTRQNGTSHI